LDPKNLQHHGLHTRTNHLLLNMPLLGGPLTVIALIEFVSFAKDWTLPDGRKLPAKKKRAKGDMGMPEKVTLGGVIISGLFFLSLAPHQELRFLVPLVFPLILVLQGALTDKWMNARYFLPAWFIFNAGLSFFYGVVHQGGVVPSLIFLQNKYATASPEAQVDIVYTYTYMPPRSLLTIPATSERANMYDIGGPTLPQLQEFIHNLTAKDAQPSQHLIYVVSPENLEGIDGIGRCESFELQKKVWPHFSSEAPSKDFTLRVYKYQSGCAE